MNIEYYILDAVARVCAWDVPDELFAHAVSDQAKMIMAGVDPDEIWETVPN
jgi:hypothetical protein